MYAKFMKDLLIKKGKYIDNEIIVVEGNCSAIIQRILPQKFKDLESVTIPCYIGTIVVGKTLINLRVSINLMPLSMYKRLGNLKVVPTKSHYSWRSLNYTTLWCGWGCPCESQTINFLGELCYHGHRGGCQYSHNSRSTLHAHCKLCSGMGNDNLETSVKDQKVSFNLFDSTTTTSIENICFEQGTID